MTKTEIVAPESSKLNSIESEIIEKELFILKLYVAGTTPKSIAAITNIKRICEDFLHGKYNLEVIDLYQNPSLAKGEQIIAVPTLIKKLPSPLRRIIGDMSNVDKVIVGLDLKKVIVNEN
jgi:circadian clock protein KaiB